MKAEQIARNLINCQWDDPLSESQLLLLIDQARKDITPKQSGPFHSCPNCGGKLEVLSQQLERWKNNHQIVTDEKEELSKGLEQLKREVREWIEFRDGFLQPIDEGSIKKEDYPAITKALKPKA